MVRLLAALVAVVTLAARSADAQVSFTTPDNSSATLAHCKDYFSYEWNEPIDMSSTRNAPLSDVPKNDYRDLDALAISNGVLSFTSTGISPALTLIQAVPLDPATQQPGAIPVGSRYGEKHPIDTSSYHNFVVRMYSSQETFAQLLWGINNLRLAVTNFKVYQGWHNYVVDLNSVTVTPIAGSNLAWNQGSWEQLVFIPTNTSGVSISVDYIQLLSDTGCGSDTISFSATASGGEDKYLVAVDTDTDPSNGVEMWSTGDASGSVTKTVGGAASDLPIATINPGSHYVYGFMTSDWATLKMADPWDFSGSEDLQPSATFNISDTSFSGGSFSGTTTSGDPVFYLNMRGRELDASTYTTISIGISYTFPSGVPSGTLDVLFFNDYNYLGIKRISSSTTSGYQVYTAVLGPGDGWSGTIDSIRIDPVNDNPSIGTRFSIDFVSIRDSGTVSSLGFPTVNQAPGLLKVNNPSLSFVQPDKRGGRDFAQTVLGNSWNMNSAEDIATLANASSGAVYPNNAMTDPSGKTNIGDFFRFENQTGNGDPQCPPLDLASAERRINTVEYMNLCFRGWNKTETAGFNSVARVIWHDAAIADARTAYKDGDDIIFNQGSAEYCLDLSQDLDSRTEPAQAPGSPNPWTNVSATGSAVDTLRIDMNEAEEAYYSVLDYVHLRADHESNSQYAIVIDAPLTETIDLTYKPASGGSETAIGTLSSGRNTQIYLWDTSGIAAGKYKIIGRVTQNGNTFVREADGRIDISHSRAQDSTAPILSCERPTGGYTFNSVLEVAGYALDETRLATVEVFVDNQYLKSIVPSQFHLAARDAYPNYAESNNPGFQELISASHLAMGAHQVTIKATDTAGNETSCSYATTRGGSDTPPLTYPSNDGTPENVPVYVPRNVQPKVSVKLQAKSKVSYTITGVEECSTVSLFAGTDSNLTYAVTIATSAGASSIAANTLNVPTFEKQKKSKDDGIIYFMARCDTGELSSKVTLNAKKTKNKKKSKSEKSLLNFLKSKTKIGA